MKKYSVKSLEEAKALVNIAMTTGQMLIQNGAEVYRAEDTIERMIGSRSNMKDVDVSALSSAIFVSAEYGDESITLFKDINSSGVNLTRIDALNTFSRHFVRGEISFRDARKQLIEISQIKKHPLPVSMFFTGLCSASSVIMFNGGVYDAIYSFFLGFILNFFLRYLARYNISFFPETFMGTFVVSLLALLGSGFSPLLHLDKIIIGSIIPMVPGMAITNSFRDIISGDYVSGLVGATKGSFIALAIALGVGFILNLQKMLGV